MEGLEFEQTIDEINLEDKEKIIEPGKGLDSCIPLSLPETLYSSLIVLPLCETIGKTACHRRVINFSLYFCLAANFVIQGFFLRYVYKIYVDNKEELGVCGGRETDQNLRVFCILIYTAYCFSDVAETLKMASFIWEFPRSKKFEKLLLKSSIDEDGEKQLEFSSGMTYSYKLYCYLCILFPKFVIATCLLTYGTGFVVTTDVNENLILNALALGFVLDIDNMAYEYFMTFQMREVIGELPPVVMKDSKMLKINTHYGTYIKAIFLSGLTYATLNAYCPNP